MVVNYSYFRVDTNLSEPVSSENYWKYSYDIIIGTETILSLNYDILDRFTVEKLLSGDEAQAKLALSKVIETLRDRINKLVPLFDYVV